MVHGAKWCTVARVSLQTLPACSKASHAALDEIIAHVVSGSNILTKLLVLVAQASTGRSLAVLTSYHVWLVSLLSGGVAVASVVVNDYFDYKVDAQNAPTKPLPSGAVAPDVALLLSSIIYCAVLITACLMEPSGLRSIIAFSAAVTLLYTPVFKKLTAIKNATVATVIALAPLAGALAAGAVRTLYSEVNHGKAINGHTNASLLT